MVCQSHGDVISIFNSNNNSSTAMLGCTCDSGWSSYGDFLAAPSELNDQCGQPLMALTVIYSLALISRVILLCPLTYKIVSGIHRYGRAAMAASSLGRGDAQQQQAGRRPYRWYITLITFPTRFMLLLATEHIIIIILAASHLLPETKYTNEQRLIIGHSTAGTLLFVVWLNLWYDVPQ
jgi:hypothetical protein